MPEYKIRMPDGRAFNVTVPPGTTKEEALAYAKANAPPPQGALDPAPTVNAPGTEPGGIFSSPKGFYGPGILANVGSKIQQAIRSNPETPQQVYDRSVPTMESVVGILGNLAGPSKTLLQRMVTGTAIPPAMRVLGGQPNKLIEAAGEGAGTQGIAEILFGLLKIPRMNSLAETARAAFEKKLLGQQEKLVHDKAMLNALETMDKSAHQSQVDRITTAHKDDLNTAKLADLTSDREYKQLIEGLKKAHADKIKAQNLTNSQAKTAHQKTIERLETEHQAQVAAQTSEYIQKVSTHHGLLAGSLMDEAKKSVPSWAEIPSTAEGLLTAVLGKGKELLSASFQRALDVAKGSAGNKMVMIPVRDAVDLDLNIQRGRPRPDPRTSDLELKVPVFAAELIERLPGFADAAVKARSHEALSKAGLNIAPEAMREYAVGKGTIDLVDKNKVFQFNPKTQQIDLSPTNLTQGMLSREHMDIIQNRGMGNFDTNPPLIVGRTGIPEPPPIPKPTLPEAPQMGSVPDLELPPAPIPRAPELALRSPALPEAPPSRGPLGSPEPLISPDESGAISTLSVPGTTYQRSQVLGALGGIFGGLGGGAGHGWGGAGIGGASGYLVGRGMGAALPEQLITKAPMSPLEELVMQLGPMGLGAVIREAADITHVSAKDRDEIEAAQKNDPRLTLDLSPTDPSELR